MGFNVWRWLSDPNYRAIKRWKRLDGDRTLKFDFRLTKDSIVFDVGAYRGEYAAELARRFGCRIEAFEPIVEYADAARRAVAEFPSVTVHGFGLSDRDHEAEMSVSGLGSSVFRSGGERSIATFRDIVAFLEESGIDNVDLLKLNIEGGEYMVLPRLIEVSRIRSIRFVLVQFHLIEEGDSGRYEALFHKINATHRLRWRFPFVWELWERV